MPAGIGDAADSGCAAKQRTNNSMEVHELVCDQRFGFTDVRSFFKLYCKPRHVSTQLHTESGNCKDVEEVLLYAREGQRDILLGGGD